MPKFNELALKILNDRYLWRDDQGTITETPEELLRRVAKHIASVEEEGKRAYWEEEFYNVMENLDFLPNSPTLMNSGRKAPHGQLAACFVVDVEDSMQGICEALRQQMLIHKTGGGTGFNFSKLRAKNSTVGSTNGKASGPVSFMRLFDLSTDVVQQGGMRRGANMGILEADHADIEEFIKCKDEDGVIANFNLSVGVSDQFMLNARDKCFSKEAELLHLIAEQAWKTGDPGLVFMDAINADNPTPKLGKITATNPCGESPLLGGESCNLGSINLSNMVDKRGNIEWARLVDVVRTAVRFLDNVVEVGQYPIPEIERAVKRTRKIGLGIMGWADFLYKLKIRYGSKESFSYAETVMDTIRKTAHEYSRWLGTLKGIPEACRELKRRNATLTCIAPTGTLALLAGCSSGIEPVFSLRHTRRISTVQSDKVEEIEIFHPIYEKALKDFSIADGEIERIFVTAYNIPWKEQIEMQALFQEYTDLAVSKTVNLPAEATVEDIFDCYVYAWNRRCKGTTIYRNGSKGMQVLTVTEEALPEPKCSTC